MLHFIVDGYNLINKIDSLKKTSLKAKREALLRLLADYKVKLSSRNKITVVFDGKSEVVHPAIKNPHLNIIFSKDQDADSLIKAMIDGSENSKSLVIVTNDRDIIYFAKARNVKHKNTEDFLAQIRRKINKSGQDDSFKLDFKQAYKINEELREIWFKKFP